MSSMENSPPPDTRQGMNFVLFVVNSWSTSLEIFLHGPTGSRFMGMQAAAVLVLVPVFCMFWQHSNIMPLIYFLGAYLVKCVINRAGQVRQWAKGIRPHSYYTGKPYLHWLGPKIPERQFKLIAEPTLVLMAGTFILGLNPPLGWYMVLGSGCMFWSGLMCELRDRTVAQNWHDAVIEQRLAAERFRAMQGDQ